MNKIRKHIPAWVDTDELTEQEFASVGELMEIPWVKSMRDFHRDFTQFSVWTPIEGTEDEQFHAGLIAEYEGGSWWFNVGNLVHDVPELPRWDSRRAHALRQAVKEKEALIEAEKLAKQREQMRQSNLRASPFY